MPSSEYLRKLVLRMPLQEPSWSPCQQVMGECHPFQNPAGHHASRLWVSATPLRTQLVTMPAGRG